MKNKYQKNNNNKHQINNYTLALNAYTLNCLKSMNLQVAMHTKKLCKVTQNSCRFKLMLA